AAPADAPARGGDRGDHQGRAPQLAGPRRRLAPASVAGLWPERNQVQIVVSDGLSAEAVHHNAPDLLPALPDGLEGRRGRIGQPIVAKYGRVKLAEPLAERLAAEMVIHLIGERPG